MTDTSEQFDWFDNDSVIVPEQEAIAVYTNPKGAVVIRRMQRWDETDDQFFIIEARNAVDVAEAMLRAAGSDARVCTPRMLAMMQQRQDIDWEAINEDFDELRSEQKSKDRTAAKRQRRYRANKKLRDSVTETVTPAVTDRDGTPVTPEIKAELNSFDRCMAQGQRPLKLELVG